MSPQFGMELCYAEPIANQPGLSVLGVGFVASME